MFRESRNLRFEWLLCGVLLGCETPPEPEDADHPPLVWEGERVVFVRNERGFEARQVATGREDDRAVEIVSGLFAGEAIATGNTFILKAELGKAEAEHHH